MILLWLIFVLVHLGAQQTLVTVCFHYIIWKRAA